jgi:hypothetical protein
MLWTGNATGAAQFLATEVYGSSVNTAGAHGFAMELLAFAPVVAIENPVRGAMSRLS